ncbi:unnamed protein product, partial [Bubo scandiacus]
SYFIGDEEFGQQQHNLYHCISSSSRHVTGNGGSTTQSSITVTELPEACQEDKLLEIAFLSKAPTEGLKTNRKCPRLRRGLYPPNRAHGILHRQQHLPQ